MIKCIRSAVFLFRFGKAEERASVKSCTGWVMYPVRLRKNRVYTFSFDVNLSEGGAEAVLIRKRQQMKLGAGSGAVTLEVKENSWAFFAGILKELRENALCIRSTVARHNKSLPAAVW